MGIFEPFRALGYITTQVPFSVQRLGTETFVTVSVGKAFQVYNCAKLSLVVVGPQLPKKIRALASYRDYTFAAYGHNIAVFKRAHLVATWESHNAKVNKLLLLGDCIISTDVKGNIFIWAFKGVTENLSPVGHISLENKFTPTCIMHPDTYLEQVLLGSQEGSLQLWDISTMKKIHVHNILRDIEIVSFTHSTKDPVTALSFSTDGQPLLASGGSSGVITIWNLETKRFHSVIKEAHDCSIVSLHFFAREPVLMSSSADNSIKMWIFDTSEGDPPRLLRFRSGHSAPPLCIKFYANGRHILCAGQDRAFRLFSVIQDQQSRELSQRHVSKRAKSLKVKEAEIKLKPVIAFDVAEIRERDWCNVVTCHMDTAQAYVWRLQNFVIGEHILSPCPGDPTPVKACAISACGNFAVVGTAGGWIERFNLQSGISRGSYVDTSERKPCAHDGEVVVLLVILPIPS
ncbi:U3 small nucleolar RNA-associated protein 21 [Sesamum angolense]|uniref:U3 small nucleolar RNA-associated protein 21 n=1 Tax=Sesamum angolense TaxID=2727404 RepID=A0AAE1T8M0_9LAMI|nr:U3 small nucleolar RNA-associated protein 21 [Sesamum angolense]